MKRIILSAILILAITFASFARKVVAEGKSFTTMGSFKIETADQAMVLNGVPLDTYVITYQTGFSVKVAIEKDKKCRRYITVSDNLCVQYVCNEDYFGVEKLNKRYAGEGLKTGYESMDRTSYFHQRVLTPGQENPIDCMKLIGAYFPELLKDTPTA